MAAAAPVAAPKVGTPAPKATDMPKGDQTKPTTPAATTAPKEPKKEKEVLPVYDNADALLADVAKRDRGPRRPYQVDFSGKSYFVMAGHMDHAMRQVMTKLGGTATEIGKTARAPKVQTPDSLITAIGALGTNMSPEDLAKVTAAIEALKAQMAAKK